MQTTSSGPALRYTNRPAPRKVVQRKCDFSIYDGPLRAKRRSRAQEALSRRTDHRHPEGGGGGESTRRAVPAGRDQTRGPVPVEGGGRRGGEGGRVGGDGQGRRRTSSV